MSMESPINALDLSKPFSLDGCYIDPASGLVRNGKQESQLQPQAIEVLQYLAHHPGKVITRQEIEEAVWKDRTVGYDALTGTMFKLRKALGDNRKSPRIIETLSRRGYRMLVSPIPAGTKGDEILHRGSHPEPPCRSKSRLVGTTWTYVPLGILGFCIIAALLSLYWPADKGPINSAGPRQKSAIVVLPFDNLGLTKEAEYLADGVTDDLTTALARTSGLTVIARDSAFVYKGEDPTTKEIGQRLNVDLILRGSLRQQGERVRVNVRLINAADGRHLWAESFDSTTEEILDAERQIIKNVYKALPVPRAPIGLDQVTVARTDSPIAYRAFQLGRQHFYLYLNKQENRRARQLFDEALRLDPKFSMAQAMLAWTHAFDAMNGWTSDRDASLRLALEGARKAISLDKGLPLSYFITALVHRERREYVKAMVEAEEALALNSNYANAHVLLATLLYYAGRPSESVERVKRAMRLNPHHPFNYSFHLGQAYFTLRRYDDAIAALEQGIKSNPASERLHLWLAAALAHAGRIDDALWEAEQVYALNPEFALASITASYPFKDESDKKHFLDGLRKAGLS